MIGEMKRDLSHARRINGQGRGAIKFRKETRSAGRVRDPDHTLLVKIKVMTMI
jgi:hypothetical protein